MCEQAVKFAHFLLAGLGGMLVLGTSVEASGVASVDKMYSPASIKEDLDQFVHVLLSTHPRLNYTTDLAILNQKIELMRSGLDERMTARDVWRELAQVNPLLADAHMGIRYPIREFEAFRAEGGAVFPIPVRIEDGGKIYADHVSTAEDVGPIPSGARILSINGRSAQEIVSSLMPMMRGESETIRRMVMAHNFAAYLWALYDLSSFTVTYRATPDSKVQAITLNGDAPALRRSRSDPVFQFSIHEESVGYLNISTFDIAHQQDFHEFLVKSFTEIANRGIEELVIDLRNNKGGAHELSDMLSGYLTGKRIRQASALIARITESNSDLAPNTPIGSVKRITLEEWIEPEDNRLRFDGHVVLLIGKRTYSQAIVFSAMFQDYGIGRIAGETTDGWANQTGQVQMIPLKNTGLMVAVPLYIIIRPSGEEIRGGVQPDWDSGFGSPELKGFVEKLIGEA